MSIRFWVLLSLAGLILYLQAHAHANPEQNKITVYVTVDWEGWSLDEENLEAMRRFRILHPQIPMLHLLNPAYFLRPGVDAEKIATQIRSTLLPIDKQGLHLHAWKLLMQRCQVPYKSTPSFANADEACPGRECGYTVSLELAYSEPELTQLVQCSAALLREQGFEQPRHFRAGAWQFGPKLAAALKNNDFSWDSSRTDADLLIPRWGAQSALVAMLRQLHPDASIFDQPTALLPGLMQYPNNASLMDYTSAAQLLTIFKALIAANKPVMVTGFHQETAFDYLDNLEEAIRLMEQAAQAANVKLEWGSYE